MNENLNLVEILKDCPKGTKLYSLIYGDVELEKISNDENDKYPIFIRLHANTIDCVAKDGRYIGIYDGECVLFPSKDQRDWSKFKPTEAYITLAETQEQSQQEQPTPKQEIDWEQRRYEIAKEMMYKIYQKQVAVSNRGQGIMLKDIADIAVAFADTLIKELKEKSE